jgi:acetyl esterase
LPDEGALDPFAAEWLRTNPLPVDDFSPEFLALARGSFELPVERRIASVHDEVAAGVSVRVYEHAEQPTGLVVYFHGGGWCLGSVALMDNVARELAHVSGAVVVSVEYRLAPENPYPAGLHDCEAVTRWGFEHAADFHVPQQAVMVAGESAGGNLATAVALRLGDAGAAPRLAGQVLVYPVLEGSDSSFPSRKEFAGLVVSEAAHEWFWDSYSGGRDIGGDPFAAPLRAKTLVDLPPALVILGGCDFLRDEGRAYAERLQEAGVETEEVCYPGQPHGFVNFGFPAAQDAFVTIGRWVRRRFAAVAP